MAPRRLAEQVRDETSPRHAAVVGCVCDALNAHSEILATSATARRGNVLTPVFVCWRDDSEVLMDLVNLREQVDYVDQRTLD